jgi:hypothetical protein
MNVCVRTYALFVKPIAFGRSVLMFVHAALHNAPSIVSPSAFRYNASEFSRHRGVMKRSSQVVLLLMGVSGVGAGAYAMMPARQCTPAPQPGAVAPRVPGAPVISGTDMQGVTPAVNPCPPSRWSSGSGSGSHWSRPVFRSSSSTTATRTSIQPSRVSTPGSSISPGTASRGGFGSTGRGFSSTSS